MRFRITPTSKNICATRQVYRKGNQEIMFGEIFTDFELITANHKDWIKSYSSELGVCLDDIDCIDSNFNSDSINPVIFFSETTPPEERQKLTKLFKRNKDSLYAFENAISNLNWNYVETKSYFWGDIKIEKYFGSPESQKLLKKINLIIDKSRDEIISECEYIDNDDELDYFSFYEDLLHAIGWNTINIQSNFYKNILMEQQSLRSPMIDGNKIYGRYTFMLADCVEDIDKEWTEEEWEEIVEDCMYEWSGPFETGDPHGSKGYYCNNLSLQEAFDNYEGDLLEMIRPMYQKLSSDDEGKSFDEYLKQYGEHPKELIEFIERYEDSLNQ